MLDPSEQNFIKIITRNKINSVLLERLPTLNLPDWYLVAGCLFQTVWNELSGYPLEYGIKDYDVFYCDCSDLSWEAENKFIKQCAEAFTDIGAEVQVRNQARVHLWYEQKYGTSCPQMYSSREGIDGFLNQSSCFGVRRHLDGSYEVYSPFGFTDLFDMIIRPTFNRDAPDVYYRKTKRWNHVWPKLQVLPWDSTSEKKDKELNNSFPPDRCSAALVPTR
ncbi:MAG: nucleotidyltransferase family protein [Syntrophaceae bacterium]|nr:nucleotidyltransferase family protein [Syntrophaceae bacterium]